jgi:phospholipid/cholesterol/gamma-HCH transport system substrate-binding protein
MTRRNPIDIAAGAVVLAVAIGFLIYAVTSTGHGDAAGDYVLHARFSSISGLATGSDVRLAGVKVGSVTAAHIDPRTFEAVVDFTVADDLRLPTDTSVQVTSSGLLGGASLALTPGGEEKTIPPGGTVTITQSAVSLEDLLGKFIFNVGSLTDAVQKSLRQKPAASGSGSGSDSGSGLAPLR